MDETAGRRRRRVGSQLTGEDVTIEMLLMSPEVLLVNIEISDKN